MGLIGRAVLAAVVLGVGWMAGTTEASAQATPPTVTPTETAAELSTRRPEETQSDAMLAFDINKDGRLELAEVKSAAAARYDELDPDQDDKLDNKEAGPVFDGETFRLVDTGWGRDCKQG